MSKTLTLLTLPLLFLGGAQPTASEARLSELATLAGEWAMMDSAGRPTDLRARYAVVAGDQAVLETLFVGTPEETVTLYHLEGRDLSLTQVSARSGPVRLVAEKGGARESLRFALKEGPAVEGGVGAVELAPLDSAHLRIAWSLTPERGEPMRREMDWMRQDSVPELARKLAKLRVDLDSLQDEIDGRLKVSVSETSAKGEAELLELRTVPGSAGWNMSGVPVRKFLHRQTTPFVSTFAAAGDGGLTVGHYPFVAGEDCRVSFSVLGGHAYLAVVEEDKAPARKIKSIQEFSEELLTGKYGTVVESISAKRWSDYAVAVEWDLSRFAGKAMRLYLVDAVTDHYGQIAVSEVRITETAP